MTPGGSHSVIGYVCLRPGVKKSAEGRSHGQSSTEGLYPIYKIRETKSTLTDSPCNYYIEVCHFGNCFHCPKSDVLLRTIIFYRRPSGLSSWPWWYLPFYSSWDWWGVLGARVLPNFPLGSRARSRKKLCQTIASWSQTAKNRPVRGKNRFPIPRRKIKGTITTRGIDFWTKRRCGLRNRFIQTPVQWILVYDTDGERERK